MLGQGTDVINGSRVPVYTNNAFTPAAFSPQINAGTGTPPNIPPLLTGTGSTINGAQSQTSQNAAAFPFNLQMSPLVWAVLGLAIGLIGLRVIHWRTILEDVE